MCSDQAVAFRLLPLDFPAWRTIYSYFRRWQRAGVWDQMLVTLRMQMRVKQGRTPFPSAAAIESQSVKTSAVRGPDKGYDPGKKVWGRKRHVLVDTEGNLLAVKVTGYRAIRPAGSETPAASSAQGSASHATALGR